ncbi:chorismate mutase [Cyathus striatus]|nr:chorismate mutase [Cyathus striatus]
MNSLNFMSPGDPLSIDRIRGVLTRLEDTIIFSLIERAQFAHNPRIYLRGAFKELADLGFHGSWLEWFLKETESFHAKARRYSRTVLQPLSFPRILYPNKISANPSILSFYTRAIVPRITRQATLIHAATKRANGITGDEEFEDDGNYGSAATIDIEVLQSISKRVHYAFISHIKNRNRAALEALITKPEVERKLLQRLRKKATTYAQPILDDGDGIPSGVKGANENECGPVKIDVDGVVDLYESYIIPLTKEVEIDYLLCRLDGMSEVEIDKLMAKSSGN